MFPKSWWDRAYNNKNNTKIYKKKNEIPKYS